MDTEGMQGTGRTNVYDDRIFALASMLSSVLLYNLPETVRPRPLLASCSIATPARAEQIGACRQGACPTLSRESASLAPSTALTVPWYAHDHAVRCRPPSCR